MTETVLPSAAQRRLHEQSGLEVVQVRGMWVVLRKLREGAVGRKSKYDEIGRTSEIPGDPGAAPGALRQQTYSRQPG